MRPSARSNNELRKVIFEPGFSPYAEGSCLIKNGNTHVICTATVEESVPPFLRNTGSGWITAEYGMLPRATHTRVNREASRGKQAGRTLEIQRLIGRSLRAITDLKKLGERQIKIDCDVIQADGGTRTASITGSYIALFMAVKKLRDQKIIADMPLTSSLAAISCGIYKNQAILDLDYEEDSNAAADTNFIMTGDGRLIEIQGTAEDGPFDEEHFMQMFSLAKQGISQLTALQNKVILSLYND